MNCDEIRNLPLRRGKHERPEDGCCVMEKTALLIRCGIPGRIDPQPDYPFTDHPDRVSRVIGAFLRHWNDAMGDDDRQILDPYAAAVIGTATGRDDDTVRAWMCADWIVHEYTPALLRAAGLSGEAEKLEQLVDLVDRETYLQAETTLRAARSAALARRDEAWGAAEAAWAAGAAWAAEAAGAAEAAWAAGAAEAARRAADDVRASGGDWYAQRDAARDAARPYFDEAFAEIKRGLYQSALGLLDRLIDVGKHDPIIEVRC